MTWSSAPVSIRDYARRTFDRPLPLHTKLALVWVKVLATCGYELGRCRPARSRGPAQSAVRVVSYRPTTPPPTPPPDGESVAVVIPALLTSRTHRACLGRALDALAAQSPRAPDWVIVVDDGSPKPIPAADVASRVPPAVGFALLRVEPNAGPAAARNAGLAAAADRGATLVAFMDADVSPRPGWLAAHVAAQAAPGRRGLVAGLTLARRGRGPAAIVARFHDETGTLNGRLLADSQQPHQRAQQQLPRREEGGRAGRAPSGSLESGSSSGSGWARGSGGEGGRHAGRLPVPVPAPAATTTSPPPPPATGDAGDGGEQHGRRPRRLSRHRKTPPSSSSDARDDDGDETMQLGLKRE